MKALDIPISYIYDLVTRPILSPPDGDHAVSPSDPSLHGSWSEP